MTRSDAEPGSAVALFDDHAAGLHRYLARRVDAEAAADVLVETLTSPAATDDRPRLFGIATRLLRDRTEVHDPHDPLSVGLATLPAGQRDALLLAAWGRLEPDEVAVALDVTPAAAAALRTRARAALRTDGRTDTELDGALAVLRSDSCSDAHALGSLRERVPRRSIPGPEPVVTTAIEAEPVSLDGPPTRPRLGWRPVAGAVALLAVLIGALMFVGGQEPVPPQPATVTALPTTPTDAEVGEVGEVLAYSEWTLMPAPVVSGATPEGARLPTATGPVSELDLTMSDPEMRPGQYLYRRIEQDFHQVEIWIPAEVGEEWMVRDSVSIPREQRAVDGLFTWPPSFSTLTVADLSRDPSRNHTLLRVATGIAPDPQLVALTIVIDTLKHQPVSADLRQALVGALGFVPDLRVSTEDGGRTTVISAEGSGFGQPSRTDMLLDTETGQLIGDRYADGLDSSATRVTTAVADEIGMIPGP